MKTFGYLAALTLIFSCTFNSNAQNYQATLKDTTTNNIIPYASIIYAPNKGIISNEEGKFSLDLSKITQDSIYISSIGYLKKGFAINNLKDSIIYLKEEVENLELVYLSKNNYSAKEIMELVEERIDSNYQTSLTNQKIFYRKSYISKVKQFDLEMKESSIAEINEKLLDSIKNLIPRDSYYYSEMLGHYYSDSIKEHHKLTITKAAELYDKDNDLSMKGISKKMETILNENVKKDSYLKIKSGIFGSKIQVDSIIAENEEAKLIQDKLNANDTLEKNKKAKRKLVNLRWNITNLYKSMFYEKYPTFNLIDKKNKYLYTIKGYTIVNEEPCYIINFEPKGSKEFKGTLYVNVNDFAIVQMDYKNIKNLRDFSLFGISYSENLYQSKVFFRKESNGYIPYFIQLDTGSKVGIKRPLKIIEKNKHTKGRRKQNEVALKIEIEMDQFERSEYLVYKTTKIKQGEFNNLKENTDFTVKYLPKYDPNFWADETIIEPNKAIQSFSIEK